MKFENAARDEEFRATFYSFIGNFYKISAADL